MKLAQLGTTFFRSRFVLCLKTRVLPIIILPMMLATIANPTLAADLRAAIEDDYASNLEGLFKHLHQNPELSFREFETSKRLASELRNLGITVTENVGGTGIVGMLRNGKGPVVLVRADMDGLPIAEDSGLAYASKRTQEDINGEILPVMHACGHDVHMTSLIGTARQLVNTLDQWQGTVMFIGQPAEERIGGAKAMIEDNLYERFGVPDYALAFHVAAGKAAGTVSVPKALAYSSSDSVDITVYGIGAHGASPHAGKDPILIASQIVVALQTVISREISPLEPGVITVGSFHGGSKHNIIPDRVKLQLTVRSNDETVRQTLLSAIERIATGVAFTAGLPESLYPKVDLSIESTPPTHNNAELAYRVEAAIAEALGEDKVVPQTQKGMGAEDFAYFLVTEHEVPGAYFSVGGTPLKELEAAKKSGAKLPSHHSPYFKVEPEPAITAGTLAMTSAVLDLLAKD
ncbi:MAG: M20 metallopeptidase family protein [Pseudomonadales bacterium]